MGADYCFLGFINYCLFAEVFLTTMNLGLLEEAN